MRHRITCAAFSLACVALLCCEESSQDISSPGAAAGSSGPPGVSEGGAPTLEGGAPPAFGGTLPASSGGETSASTSGAVIGGSAPQAGKEAGGAPSEAPAAGTPSSTAEGGSAGSPNAEMAGSGAGGAETGGTSELPATENAGAGSLAPSAGPFPDGVNAPKIMIVGDSISAGPGCYKKYLVQNLNEAGFSRYSFVGEYTDDCDGNVRHSAVSCSTASQFTQPSFTMPNCSQGMSFSGMSTLVTNHNPDLILLQLGVNDIWNNASTEAVLNAYTLLVEQARSHNPRIVLAVAQIHKFIIDRCANTQSLDRAQQLIEAVPGWAAEHSTPDSPIFVADLWTNSDPMEADDCVHPNDAGARRMGLNWFNSLKDILPR